MKYRSRTQHQQTFRPVVVVLSNSILPLWYIQKVYEARQPNFQLDIDEVVLELDKAYARCKKLAKGIFKNVIWIIDVVPLTMVEQNKGKGRQETIAQLQAMFEELNPIPVVKVVINNPSFEIWIQLHYEGISMALETTCQTVHTALQRLIPGYAREASFYHDENIFVKTRNNLATAAIHANSLMEPDFPDLKYARTMMPVVMSLFE